MPTRQSIHFIRHGQYVLDAPRDGQVLATLGRRQARRTATRFRDCRIAKLYCSNLPRARETAQIIAEKLPGMSPIVLPYLREMLPTRVPGAHIPLEKRRDGQQRLDRIVARFLTKRPRKGDVVIVCHGNLIRAVVCRVLGTAPTRWHELGTFHCGVTSFGFRHNGQLELECFNDTGHLPNDLRTTK